jgi:hypothetical protein
MALYTAKQLQAKSALEATVKGGDDDATTVECPHCHKSIILEKDASSANSKDEDDEDDDEG